MIAWLNFSVLIISSILFSVFYVKSVSPASLEKRIGSSAYKKCERYRLIASIFMFVAGANYVIYYWFPLPLGIPRTLPWSYWISLIIATIIAVPSLYLMLRGVKDAGEETMRPKREHKLYGGIYTRIRHPQALGEFPLWWVFAFIINSPFLVIFSIAYIPVWFYYCIAEEHDLVIRYGSVFDQYRKNTGFWLPKRKK